MKKVLCMGLLSMFSVAALAAKSPESACRVKIDGQVWDVKNGNEFFQMANNTAQKSRTCVHAKIAFVSNSGRVYSSDNGRLLATRSGKKKDLSNAEANEAARIAGENCIQVSCDEIGVLRQNEPISNEIIVVPPINHNVEGY